MFLTDSRSRLYDDDERKFQHSNLASRKFQMTIISGMGYYFHELESSFGGILDKIMRCLLSAASEPHRLPACYYYSSAQLRLRAVKANLLIG